MMTKKKNPSKRPKAVSPSKPAPKKELVIDLAGQCREKLIFGFDDLVFEPCYYTGEKRRVPIIRIHVAGKATVTIYGSHLKQPEDFEQTHLIHNPSAWTLAYKIEFGRPMPPALGHIINCQRGWTIAQNALTDLKGDVSKTVLQGETDNPDILKLLSAVREIRDSKVDFKEIETYPGPIKRPYRIGEQLLDILVPAIRSADFKKIRLLEKCMKFYDAPPVKTPFDRIKDAVSRACCSLGRLPKPLEIYSILSDSGYLHEQPRFYKDLKRYGFGWLAKEYKP